MRFWSTSRFDTSDIDLIISDFEPNTARIARRRQIPSIGFGHQYAFLCPIPTIGGNPLTFWIMRNFASVRHAIGLHWHHFNCPILPPIVPDTLKSNRLQHKDNILVYLPFEDLVDINKLLQPIDGFQFMIYADIDQPKNDGQLHFRPLSRPDFLNDLSESNGVITNAGFETVSEAQQLGKKVLVKPLKGQLEQLSNAQALSILRLGTVMPQLNGDAIKAWLHSSPAEPANYPVVAQMLAEWIDAGQWEHTADLVEAAWTPVNLPA